MKKFFVLLLLTTVIYNQAVYAAVDDAVLAQFIEQTWSDFRQVYPYSYQSVGLKHADNNTYVMVISEPAPDVSEEEIAALFKRHHGRIEVKKHQLGHDGWTKDIVGYLKSEGTVSQKYFTDTLFYLLYGTSYKPYYIDLDHPSEQVHFVPYEHRLNHSWSTMDLIQLFNHRVQFNTKAGLCDIKQLMKIYNSTIGDCIFESTDYGFIVWLIDPSIVMQEGPKSLPESIIYNCFRASARRFALDTDMIIGAYGDTTGVLAIIGREREIPVTICPPLRAETILLMAQTNILDLGQAFIPNSDPAEDGRYASSILMTEQTKDTEYGDLLIMTDQMLKSWTENNYNQDCHYNLPAPAYFPFNHGLKKELDCSTIECRWIAGNLDSCIQKFDNTSIYSFKQTASLPVCLSTEEVSTEDVKTAETTARNYFSGLNQAELFRIAQYTTLCQLFNAHWWGIHVNDTVAESEEDISDQERVSSTLTCQNSWLKTPSITCSNEPWATGGLGRFIVKGGRSIARGRTLGKIHDYTVPRTGELERITADYLKVIRSQQNIKPYKPYKPYIPYKPKKTKKTNKTNKTDYQPSVGINHQGLANNPLSEFKSYYDLIIDCSSDKTPKPVSNKLGTTIGEDVTIIRSISSRLEQHRSKLELSRAFSMAGSGIDPKKLPSVELPNYVTDFQFIFDCLTDKEIDLKILRSTSGLPSHFYERILNSIQDLQSKDKPQYNHFINTLKTTSPSTYSMWFHTVTNAELEKFLSDFPDKYNSHLEKLKELLKDECVRKPQKTQLKWMLPQWLEKPKVSSHTVHVDSHRTAYQIRHKKDKFTHPGYDIDIKSPHWNTRLNKHTVGLRIGRGFTENLNKPYSPKRSINWNKNNIEIKDEGQLNELLAHPESKTNVTIREYSAAEDIVTINGENGQQTCIVPRDNANWDMHNAEFEGYKDNVKDGTTSFTFQQKESDLPPGCKSSKATVTVPQSLKDGVLKNIGKKAAYWYKVVTNPNLFRNILHERKNINPEDFNLEINRLYGQFIFLKDYNYDTEYPFQSAA